MRYISTFSGIEAASVAWQPLGWEPVAFCENDPFPSAVLAERFPEVPNLGDITQVNWRKYRGAIDVVVGGSPCQSFSVAGNRTGRAGESGLMAEYIRCVREVRPRWFVWENVPGALSCEGGAAFGQLLAEMGILGYGVAWRVLDAQFFGVPQRRRRVFLIGHLGDLRATEVLFELEGMRGDYLSSKKKREAIAAARRGGVGEASQPVGAVAFVQNQENKVRLFGGDGKTVGALAAESGVKQQCFIATDVVRKLTPRECERLQGFPDDWTLVEWRGKPAPDTRRYKAIGNSMAVPVMRWIGERMEGAE